MKNIACGPGDISYYHRARIRTASLHRLNIAIWVSFSVLEIKTAPFNGAVLFMATILRTRTLTLQKDYSYGLDQAMNAAARLCMGRRSTIGYYSDRERLKNAHRIMLTIPGLPFRR